jgi:hypothetical protein
MKLSSDFLEFLPDAVTLKNTPEKVYPALRDLSFVTLV